MDQMNLIVQALTPLIVIILAGVFLAYRAKKTHFECPVCGCSFKLSGLSFAFTIHMGLNRLVTCPNCGYRGMLPTINDAE